jgi:hypothetical protein
MNQALLWLLWLLLLLVHPAACKQHQQGQWQECCNHNKQIINACTYNLELLNVYKTRCEE